MSAQSAALRPGSSGSSAALRTAALALVARPTSSASAAPTTLARGAAPQLSLGITGQSPLSFLHGDEAVASSRHSAAGAASGLGRALAVGHSPIRTPGAADYAVGERRSGGGRRESSSAADAPLRRLAAGDTAASSGERASAGRRADAALPPPLLHAGYAGGYAGGGGGSFLETIPRVSELPASSRARLRKEGRAASAGGGPGGSGLSADSRAERRDPALLSTRTATAAVIGHAAGGADFVAKPSDSESGKSSDEWRDESRVASALGPAGFSESGGTAAAAGGSGNDSEQKSASDEEADAVIAASHSRQASASSRRPLAPPGRADGESRGTGAGDAPIVAGSGGGDLGDEEEAEPLTPEEAAAAAAAAEMRARLQSGFALIAELDLALEAVTQVSLRRCADLARCFRAHPRHLPHPTPFPCVSGLVAKR